MSEVEMEPLSEIDMAFLEQEQIGCEVCDRLLAAGANEDDVKYIAWMAGLVNWKPERIQ